MRYRSWKGDRERVVETARRRAQGRAMVSRCRRRGFGPHLPRQPIRDLELRDDTFERPEGFVLAAHWTASTARMERETHPLVMRLKLTDMGAQAPQALHDHLGPRADRHRKRAGSKPVMSSSRCRPKSPEPSASLVLRLGPEAEVLDPPEIRSVVTDWVCAGSRRPMPRRGLSRLNQTRSSRSSPWKW